MGLIYKYTSPSGKSYIGQTYTSFEQRRSEHKSDAKKAVQNNWEKPEGCIAFMYAIAKYGIENFEQEILLVCKDDRQITPKGEDTELDCFEKQFIKQFNTLYPNGYNLTEGGNNNKILSNETKKKISERTKIAMAKLGPKLKRSEESKDFPMYVTYYDFRTHKGYRIQDHPKCKHKEFNIATYETLENAYNNCIEYIKKLDDLNFIHSKPIKKGNNLPTGMYLDKSNKYYIQKIINKRKYISKLFDTIDDANIYLNTIINDPKSKELPKIGNLILGKEYIELDSGGFIVEYFKNGKRLSKSFRDKNKTREENYNDSQIWLTQIKN